MVIKSLKNSYIYLSIGAFGLVKVGWLRSEPGKKYAIKSMKKHEIIQSKHVDHIENEKLILSKLDHPFSVSLQICNLLLPLIARSLFYPDHLYRTCAALLRWILPRRSLHLLRDGAPRRRRPFHLPPDRRQLQQLEHRVSSNNRLQYNQQIRSILADSILL